MSDFDKKYVVLAERLVLSDKISKKCNLLLTYSIRCCIISTKGRMMSIKSSITRQSVLTLIWECIIVQDGAMFTGHISFIDRICQRYQPPVPPVAVDVRMEHGWVEVNGASTVVKEKKIGRNEPCPCGSGLKYKKCCGKN